MYMHKCLSCPEFSSYLVLEISLSSYLIKPYTSVCTHSSKIRILCSTILKSFALNSTFKVKQWKFELLHIISWTWEWWYKRWQFWIMFFCLLTFFTFEFLRHLQHHCQLQHIQILAWTISLFHFPNRPLVSLKHFVEHKPLIYEECKHN